MPNLNELERTVEGLEGLVEPDGYTTSMDEDIAANYTNKEKNEEMRRALKTPMGLTIIKTSLRAAAMRQGRDFSDDDWRDVLNQIQKTKGGWIDEFFAYNPNWGKPTRPEREDEDVDDADDEGW